MNTQIEWKAEVSFTGDEKEFLSFADALSSHRLQVTVGGKLIPQPIGGVPRWPEALVIPVEQLTPFIKDMPVLMEKRIGGIAGGIRIPHVHVGDKVYLLTQERFGQYLGELGRRLAVSIAEETTDHVVAMERMGNMVSQGEIAPQIGRVDLIQKSPM